MSVGSSPTVMGYVFRILELQFMVLKLPSNMCQFNLKYVSGCRKFSYCYGYCFPET